MVEEKYCCGMRLKHKCEDMFFRLTTSNKTISSLSNRGKIFFLWFKWYCLEKCIDLRELYKSKLLYTTIAFKELVSYSKNNWFQCFLKAKNLPVIIKGCMPLFWFQHLAYLHNKEIINVNNVKKINKGRKSMEKGFYRCDYNNTGYHCGKRLKNYHNDMAY